MRSAIPEQIRKSYDMGDIHVNLPLSAFSVAYMQNLDEFIADKVFPKIPVPKQTGKYYRFARDAFARARGRKWIPGTPMPQSSFDLDSTPEYSCEFRAFEHPLRWDIAMHADSQVNFDRSVSEFITRSLLIGREEEFATNFFKDGIWGADLTGDASGPNSTQVVYWDDPIDSNPVADVVKICEGIKRDSLFSPNTLVLPLRVFNALRLHPIIKDYFKYTQVPLVTEDMLAKVFGLQKLYVAQALHATTEEGMTMADDATDTDFDWIFSDGAWIGYVPASPSMMMPASGYTFNFTGLSAGYDISIQKFPDPRYKVDYTQGLLCYDQKIISPSTGAFIKGVLTP
jgi:hypothetical protein